MSCLLRGLLQNFYPRPPRGGRLCRGQRLPARGHISIHALREEGDRDSSSLSSLIQYFYPRPPRGGRPLSIALNLVHVIRFLSTPSARRATAAAGRMSARRWKFLSTPSARRATPQGRTCNLPCRISIHALREEGDSSISFSKRRARISIHALREEGD